MDDRSLAAFSLTTKLGDSAADPLTAKHFWPLLGCVPKLETLVGMSESEIQEKILNTSIDPGRVVALLDRGIGLAHHLSELQNRGITVIAGCSDQYPDRLKTFLRTAAPPLLYAAGDPRLLGPEGGLGVVGSRDVSAEGREVAQNAAIWAQRNKTVLISGGARGVDQISMQTAFEVGGQVIGVLADSLEKTLNNAQNRQAVLDGEALLCTPYNPTSGFSTGNAMGRNKLIYALSKTTLVIATAQGSGGTWSGATEAIKRNFGSVTVWRGPGEGPGNRALEEDGAIPITDLDELANTGPVSPTINEQVALPFNNDVTES